MPRVQVMSRKGDLRADRDDRYRRYFGDRSERIDQLDGGGGQPRTNGGSSPVGNEPKSSRLYWESMLPQSADIHTSGSGSVPAAKGTKIPAPRRKFISLKTKGKGLLEMLSISTVLRDTLSWQSYASYHAFSLQVLDKAAFNATTATTMESLQFVVVGDKGL